MIKYIYYIVNELSEFIKLSVLSILFLFLGRPIFTLHIYTCMFNWLLKFMIERFNSYFFLEKKPPEYYKIIEVLILNDRSFLSDFL